MISYALTYESLWKSQLWRIFFLAFIISSSIMIGIGTFEFITENEHANAVFYYCDLVFLSIFSVEMGLDIFHLRYDAVTDIWLIFDFLIIIISWISVDSLGEGTNDFQVMGSLCIFRVLLRIEALKDVLAAIGR